MSDDARNRVLRVASFVGTRMSDAERGPQALGPPRLRADRRIAARPVLHDHGFAERGTEPFGKEARHQIFFGLGGMARDPQCERLVDVAIGVREFDVEVVNGCGKRHAVLLRGLRIGN